MNFFKLYMGDYQRDTGALSIAEHGAYFLMLQYHYATEKPLPKGKDLYRLIRCESKIDREAVDMVAGLYWTDTPEGLVNSRATREIAKASDQSDTNRRIAQEREERRRLERIEHERLNEASHEPCSVREPSHSHSQTKEKEPAAEAAQTIWDFGVTVLGEQGIKQQTARSFLASLLKQWDEPLVEAALRSSVGKGEVKSYLLGCLKDKPKKGESKKVVI